ncbi:MAG: hypothetical protein N2747_02860 [Chitinophagaceae bacterium]|nr:hypothetical protein [Chitinophagaceae bacterium]
MKKLISGFLLIYSFSMILFSCKKSQDFIRDNTTPTGVGYAPVSNNPILDYAFNPPRSIGTTSGGATSYPAGSTILAELTFFSQSPIKETQFYTTAGTGPRTLTATIPYSPAFSERKGLDTLIVPYTVPATVPVNTVIRMEYEIINQNGLKVVRTVFIRRT